MEDPFSIGTGVAGVVGLAIHILQSVTQFGLDWKDAPAEARAFEKELRVFVQTLSATQTSIAQNPDFAAAFEKRPSLLLSQLGPNAPDDTDAKTMLRSCQKNLQDLLQDLQKRAKGHRVGWERLKGAFLVKQTRESVENLHRQFVALNHMVAIDGVALVAKTHAEVKVIQEDQRQDRQEQRDAIIASQRWREEDGAQKILSWLSAEDYGSQQSDFFHRREPDTGQWLLESTEYETWQSKSAATLYCDGMPGAGKTIMTSIVVNHLHKQFENDRGTGIAYLYYNFRRQDEQTPVNLLASVLKQMVLQRPNMPAEIEKLYERHYTKQTRPSLEDITTTLYSIAGSYSKSFIVVDALDECSMSHGERQVFISELLKLQAKARSNIFVTSRIQPQIAREFGTGCIRREIQASDADVRKYLDSQIDRLPAFVRKSTDVQEEVKKGITNIVKGMFLLARLHLESLTGLMSIKALRNRLESLQTGSNAYDDAYKEAMDRIKGQNPDARDLALRALAWISRAKRPLSVTEVRHALAVEQGKPELDKDNLSEEEDILSVCAGLVVVDKESQIMRLVHYTTQEFFEHERTKCLPHAQLEITRTCVTYLSFDTFDSGFCRSDGAFEERLRLNPLYEYAAQHWGLHAFTVSTELTPLLLNLVLNEKKVSGCSQVLILAPPGRRFPKYSQHPRCKWTAVHVAAYFGLRSLMETLLQNGCLPDLRDSESRSLLSIAAENGREAVVELLLERDDVEADSKDLYGHTPLSRAARRGHETIVKVLVERDDVEADSKDKMGRTPLLWAAKQGHEKVVKLLLERNAEVDSKDKNGRTPLSWAAQQGHEKVVKLLLEWNTEVDTKDMDSRTPLSWAAQSRREAVVKLLLERNAKVDSKDIDDRTPLSWAAKGAWPEQRDQEQGCTLSTSRRVTTSRRLSASALPN